MFDVSGLIPEAQPIALAVAQVYWRHTVPWFIGLVCFGSAVRGSVIAGASDLDFHLYLEDAAFTPQETLPLELCLAIHRDLAHINPAPFRYIDAGAERSFIPEHHVGPIPGAYHLIAGRLPVPEATTEQLRAQAHWALANLTPAPSFMTEGLLQHGAGRGGLALTVRTFCQTVWPVLYQVLSLQHADAVAVWRLPKEQAMSLLPVESPMGCAIRSFYAAVRAYYPTESSLEHALTILEQGAAFLNVAKSWWEQLPVVDR